MLYVLIIISTMSLERLPAHAGDRIAIGFAGLCAFHCLVLLLVIPVLPWLTLIAERESEVHRLLLLAIVPVSAYALLRGCQRHRRLTVFVLGALAVGILLLAPFAKTLPSGWEPALTLIGSGMLSVSHLLNLQAMRQAHAGFAAAT